MPKRRTESRNQVKLCGFSPPADGFNATTPEMLLFFGAAPHAVAAWALPSDGAAGLSAVRSSVAGTAETLRLYQTSALHAVTVTLDVQVGPAPMR